MKSKLVKILITCLAATLLSTATGQADQIKVVAKKTAKPIPSPAAKWPPEGFKGKEGVFAKVPSSKEVIGLLSAKKSLQPLVKTCEEFASAQFLSPLKPDVSGGRLIPPYLA